MQYQFVSVATTAVAVFAPSALYVVSACVFGLAVFNLLFTAVVFDVYDNCSCGRT